MLPASYQVDFDLLKEASGARSAVLAGEQEFRDKFPGCELGAMPPFGSLYEMRVFVDEMVTEVDDLCFNAGSHEQILRMDCGDYLKLEQPVVGSIAVKE